MNRLREYFDNENHRLIDKWIHYFDIYEKHLSAWRGKKINLLEIGVSHGGSLQMWKDYFGEGSEIFGVDINPECEKFEEQGIKIYTGSQSDRSFLRYLKTQLPPLDILIDDGGHEMNQQLITFEELFDHVKEDGIYICEDLHTSYWLSHGGGYKRRGTFIEFSKNLVDYLHGWHSVQKNLKVNKFTRSVYGLHYYDSILVIEKKEIQKPYSLRKGEPGFPEEFDWSGERSLIKIIQDYYNALLAKLRIAKRL